MNLDKINTSNEEMVHYTDQDVAIMKKIARRLIEAKRHEKTISRYEYFMLGGKSYEKALSMLYYMILDRKISSHMERSALRKYLTVQIQLGSVKKYDYIMATHYQFGDFVVSDELKKEIWNKTIESGISENDIDDLVFSGAVRAYAIENGLIAKPKDNNRRIRKK